MTDIALIILVVVAYAAATSITTEWLAKRWGAAQRKTRMAPVRSEFGPRRERSEAGTGR